MYRRASETTDVGRVMETAEQPSAYVPVADFYAGRSVFMTGVTGFLGKVFLEKLLYSCKDIDNVYVLIRDKKGKNSKQRIEDLINKPLFSRLKQERPDDFNKVIPIAGDINHPDLGISKKDEEILLQKVSVVFHGAATIRFNEELKVAVNTNVTGTKYVLRLCQRMKNIKAFVHVSTAYCNADKQILEEKVYPPLFELSKVQTFLEQSNHDKEQIKALLKGQPNTYTLTKALAEAYVAENYGNIPTVIIRPSTVSASLREPLAGWVDNWAGATGMLAAIMKGGIRVILGDGDNILDLIPVDYVTNLTIVAAARCSSSVNVAVYNSCTSSCNPITLECLKRAISRKGFGSAVLPDLWSRWVTPVVKNSGSDQVSKDDWNDHNLEWSYIILVCPKWNPGKRMHEILGWGRVTSRATLHFRALPIQCSVIQSILYDATLDRQSLGRDVDGWFKHLKQREHSTSVHYGSRVNLTFTKNKCTLFTLTFLLQTLPAYLADLFRRATGKQPIYMNIQSKVVAGRDILEFFTSNSWEMKADHTRALHASLSAEDRHQFPCDPSDINWNEYVAVYIEGIKRFLLTKHV